MSKFPSFAGKYASPGFTPRNVTSPFVATAYHRETPRIPSRNADNMAPCPKVEAHRYTGDKCLGVAVMHKSNLVPVFSAEQAVDTATMRRG